MAETKKNSQKSLNFKTDEITEKKNNKISTRNSINDVIWNARYETISVKSLPIETINDEK